MAKSKKFKGVMIAVVCVLCVVLLLGIFLLVWFFADSYKDFENFEKQFEIPALSEGVVPQGLGNYGDTYFVSNYMVDGSASRLYVVDGGEERYVTFTYNGEVYDGHCGGVATDGDKLWICSDQYIYTADYGKVVNGAASGGAQIEFTERTKLSVNAAYLFYADGYLYVGEFFREQNYPTDESHRMTTTAGDYNTAICLVYETADTASGFASSPCLVYSTTERIQGFAYVNGYICLSQSYGLANSHILCYQVYYAVDDVYYPPAEDPGTSIDGYITIDGNEIPLTYLDSRFLVNDYEIPSMSEGLCVNDGEVYVLFESAGKKYRMFVRERLYNVYSFTPAKSGD